MAIVNILYPSDNARYDPIVENLRSYIRQYPTALKLTKVPNADILAATKHAFGFDIILSMVDTDSAPSVEYYLKDGTDLVYDDISTQKITLSNPNTLAKFILTTTVDYNIESLLERIKPIMTPILEDPSRNEIFRWIRDDVGSWLAKSVSFAASKTKRAYDDHGWDESYIRRASAAYSISIDRSASKDKTVVNKYYLFNRNGYVYTIKGFKKIDKVNKAIYIKDDLSLASGWTLIDGKWHLFNKRHFTENVTMIDGKLYNLKSFGMLDEDPALYEVDPNDMCILHHKIEV